MSSLTVRLDDETHALLTQLSELLKLNKSTLARQGIAHYLKQQQELLEERQKLEAEIMINDSATVRARVAESESSDVLSDEEYENSMNEFFAQELGLIR